MPKTKQIGRFHYGLEYALSHSDEEIQNTMKTLAKRNRLAREKRKEALKKMEMAKLKRQLKKELDTAFGKAIEKELGRRFRHLYCLRVKS
ncbi:MAG: hypothetical protein ACTSPV_00400 [Candidatus Hodarchaeales archaeon]